MISTKTGSVKIFLFFPEIVTRIRKRGNNKGKGGKGGKREARGRQEGQEGGKREARGTRGTRVLPM
jgi:hypothetical protein